jgi:hypothetical protein
VYGLSRVGRATRHVTTVRSSVLLFIFDASVLKSGANCSVVRFLARFVMCEMEWTQESVIEFIDSQKFVRPQFVSHKYQSLSQL